MSETTRYVFIVESVDGASLATHGPVMTDWLAQTFDARDYWMSSLSPTTSLDITHMKFDPT